MLTITALAAAAILAWVAAPALSLTPYVPAVENFAEGLAERPSSVRLPSTAYITPVVEAPHEFDLVGVAGEMRHLEIRVRDSGGEWSEWVEQSRRHADLRRRRRRGSGPGGLRAQRASSTSSTSPAPPGESASRLLSSVRAGINSAFISLASAPVAEAIAPKPSFIVRSAWGADNPANGCVPPAAPELGGVRAGVIHHTVNANDYDADGGSRGSCSGSAASTSRATAGTTSATTRSSTASAPCTRAAPAASPTRSSARRRRGSTRRRPRSPRSASTARRRSARRRSRSSIRYLAWRLGKAGLNPVTKTSRAHLRRRVSLSKYPAGYRRQPCRGSSATATSASPSAPAPPSPPRSSRSASRSRSGSRSTRRASGRRRRAGGRRRARRSVSFRRR